MSGNENKVCKLIKSLYGLKHAPKQWHQKFNEMVLSNGYLLNQDDKCIYRKCDENGNRVIIFLYVDDMLIFGTDQVQVDLTKELLSSRFSMKDMGEADVILGIRIKHESNGIAISQSHYIEKYSRVIGCLMYVMTCTRPDIEFTVGKLSRFTYTGYPSVLEGYTNVSWISNTKDNSSISGWVFLLGGGAISWASNKQTCNTGSTIESEFVALAAAGKEAECVATLAKAYSQMYNGKSRHLGVKHSIIRKLITNVVVSIEFLRVEPWEVDYGKKEHSHTLRERLGLEDLYSMNEDELAKLSSSIFVTNFPNKFSAKELWTICKQYGTVVDAFIPDRRSKAGKRPLLNKNNSQSSHNKGDQSAPKDFYKESGENVNSKSYAHVVNAGPHQFHKKEDSPTIVLDETYANKTDYSLALLGKVKDFTSLKNLNVVLANEGFVNVKLKYMGGFWVMIVFTSKGAKETFRSKVGIGSWFAQLLQASDSFFVDERVTWIDIEGIPLKVWSKNTFSRITSKWRELLDFDEHEDGYLHSKRVCIKTTLVENIYESFKVIIQGLCITPNVEGESDLEEVAETIFKKEQASVEVKEETNVDAQKNASKVLDMEGDNSGHKVQDVEQESVTKNNSPLNSYKNDTERSTCSGHFKKCDIPRSGGSILQLMEELIKVGQTMGYNMEGCITNIGDIINSQGANDGNR
ncbi:zinc finger, CCHC-type containing protein [Tanacetum coccineum]